MCKGCYNGLMMVRNLATVLDNIVYKSFPLFRRPISVIIFQLLEQQEEWLFQTKNIGF
jgi:hypothetical protein